ncbi:hypothetical protein IQ283_02395 [Alkalihalobacillus hwajinpoensis]|uniref:glycosyl hydrolase family 8 n=1 Tax=Guptibacillus hwajinpoensis TaxID=208199 RepID=UPI0018847CEF|nr:glycosyl hydrolase family 8 [Pseudalkalibacillus hwajinpoensis]MBF0705441.1 hypothetical protein [Pseudalkalibacillus hwajinpoensis]
MRLTESFIETNMKNPNGTLATYLKESDQLDQDEVKGKEAISESVGIWLQYHLKKKDREGFEEAYETFVNYFINEEGLIYWKLNPKGEPIVTTNALVDDLRIIEVLYEAASLWNEERYKTSATTFSDYLVKHNHIESVLSDFYDDRTKEISTTLTLSYIDPSALEVMRANSELGSQIYTEMLTILQKTPTDNSFYAKAYHINEQKYVFDEQVNMIDQALVAWQLAEIGVSTDSFYQFIESEYSERGFIYGRYDRNSQLPVVEYESPSLYGFIILYCLEVGDKEFAKRIYERMIEFRNEEEESKYCGGYSIKANQDTHIFDNLIPLLAEERLLSETE